MNGLQRMRAALITLSILVGLTLVALAALPWWMGAALPPLARAQGVSFERYESIGYARFRLVGVKFVRPGVVFTADHVTLDTPLRWLLRPGGAHAEISGWSVQLSPVDPPPVTKSAPASPAAVHAQVRRIASGLRRWLPRATAEQGTFTHGDETWRIAHAVWSDGALVAEGALPAGQPVRANVAEKSGSFVIQGELPACAARLEVLWAPTALRGTGTWQGQPFSLTARFDDPTWLPTLAEFQAENWDMPAVHAKLAPAYARVRGHLRAQWSDGGLHVDLQAAATPAANTTTPPLELTARVDGDRHQLILRALHVRAPFATATLTAPLTLALTPGTPAAPATLALTADLSQQPWVEAAGKLSGEIRTTPSAAGSQGTFHATVEALRWGQHAAQSGSLRGSWQAPRLQLDEANFTLDAESRIAVRGTLDWAARVLTETRVDATLGAAWMTPFLPRDLACEKIVVAAELSGPLAAPRHRGELNATQLQSSQLRPLDLHAQWSGDALALSEISATARTPNATLQLAGSVAGPRATVRDFRLERAGRVVLRSVAPAEIAWQPVWKIDGLRLEADDRALAVDAEWSAAPRVFVSAQNLASEWISDWWKKPVFPLRLAALQLRGQLRENTLVGEATAEVAAQIDGTWLQGRVAANAETDGVRISQLEVGDPRGLMAYATGRAPVRVVWSNRPQVEIDHTLPLELDASIAPDSPLWAMVRRQSQLSLTGGSIVASLTGSLAQPRGLIRLDAARLTRGEDEGANPAAAITALAATIRGQRDGFQLEALTAQIAGHAVRATGRLPMNDEAWLTLLRTPGEFDWRRGEVQLSAPRVELAALAHTFPSLPFTSGTLGAELQFANGALSGRAELHEGTSRPLPALGRLLALEAELTLAGRRVEVRTFSARLGGEPVELTGTAALGDRDQLELDLRLQARNVPLVRRPGLLVRTDLDLRAQTPARGPTQISGRVDLRDALVLADLAAILPGGPRGGSRPPPYFSIGTEPFSRWPLDVQIGGLRAVRVRTAVFNGIATPQFHLTGTLGDPRAIGQLSVDSGQVLFPFARFAVQQGNVRITAADPTQLQLAVNATAKRMGYELRLEAGGTTAAPTLAFSSNPPLESADILLLVTTGQPPKNESLAGTGPTNQQRLTRLGTFLGSGIFQNFSGTEDRLEITSGEQISEAGRETYGAKYKLTDKLSLTGEYDQYDDYNAGLSYRIYTKEGTKREERKK